MRVAVLSESSADEAAIRILIENILGRPIQAVDPLPRLIRRRGWPSVLRILPNVIRYLYYQTDADALAIVVDTDMSPVHQTTHEQPGSADSACRLCQLTQVITRTQQRLSSSAGRPPLQIAAGVAVPAIEAWYRCGLDPQVSEGTWLQGSRTCPYTRDSLKRDVYDTNRPSLALETQCAVTAAWRLAQHVSLLEQCFPQGFGALARAVRSWELA